jgi:hypothetical protein
LQDAATGVGFRILDGLTNLAAAACTGCCCHTCCCCCLDALNVFPQVSFSAVLTYFKVCVWLATTSIKIFLQLCFCFILDIAYYIFLWFIGFIRE